MPQARRRTKARQDTLELALPASQPVRLKRDSDALMVCQDNLAFMRTLAPESVQLIVTSPPYNIGKAYESKSPLTRYLEGQAKVVAECVRLLKPGGSICWQVGNHVQKGEIVP